MFCVYQNYIGTALYEINLIDLNKLYRYEVSSTDRRYLYNQYIYISISIVSSALIDYKIKKAL